MIVRATRLLRKMRGGAQAHLMEAGDGHCYVVKFTNNPQHRRILVNEWIASRFLSYLQLNAPPAAIVEITPELLASDNRIGLQAGAAMKPAPPGRHFGSRFPGDPDRVSVYDFLPDILLSKVGNRREFLGMLAFDKWMGNSDARQCVFFRANTRLVSEPARISRPDHAGHRAGHTEAALTERSPGPSLVPASRDDEPPRPAWIASMIDHGFVFDGPNWSFNDAPLAGLYHRPVFYQDIRSLDDFQPWLDRIVHFPEHVVDSALRSMPSNWIEQDHDATEALLEKLLQRRTRVEAQLHDLHSARPTLFPNWQ